jgi:hypothetical protein
VVRVVTPTTLLLEAAEVLDGIRDDVVVIGAVGVQVALADHEVVLTPTRDVDAGVATDAVERVVAHLEDRGLRPSELPHEQSFTWVQGALKVQLLCPFRPFPKGAARGLPVNNMVSELVHHRVLVVFDSDPERGRFWAARPAARVGLKEAAFGRSRFSGEPVDRDFSDVASLLDRLGEEIAAEISAGPVMRARVVRAAERLLNDEAAVTAAARELVAGGQEQDQRTAEAGVRRAARGFLRRVDQGDRPRIS